MAISFELPSMIEEQLRKELVDLDQVAKEAVLVELYRQEKLTHHELAVALGLDRFETEALLKRHRVTEDCLTLEGLDEQLATLRKLTGDMIVVSDTSPLNYLVLIEVDRLLPDLFGQVTAPPAVLAELQHSRDTRQSEGVGSQSALLAPDSHSGTLCPV